jgi:hypothetical protein
MDFDLAFDQAASGEASPAPAEPPATGEPAPPPAAKEEQAPPAVAEPAPPAKTEPPPPDPAAEWKKRAEELEAQLAEAKKVPPPKAEPQPAKEEPKPAGLTKEEDESLKFLQEDWPNVDAAMNVKFKQLVSNLEMKLASLIDARIVPLQGAMAPAVKIAQDTQQAQFMEAVTKVHPDVKEIYPGLEAWVTQQPARIKESYNAILDSSTSEEFIGLVNIYKAAIGKAAAPAPAPPADDKTERLARMEGVKRQRTGNSAEIDENDFDAAFEAASRVK